VVEPNRLPVRRLKRQWRFELRGRRRPARLHQAIAVSDLYIEAVRVLDVEGFEPLAVFVGDRGRMARRVGIFDITSRIVSYRYNLLTKALKSLAQTAFIESPSVGG
jgi:hypothetical protein